MKAVIDTNVLLIADKKHQDISPACTLTCVDRLEDFKKSGCIVIDDNFLIISEYQNKVDTNRPVPTMGTAFLKWVLNNRPNSKRVEQVHITEDTKNSFAEFPDKELEAKFDPPDRKFVAVASAHPEKLPIWQAADSKWLDWWVELASYGIQVDFLCPEDIQTFYRQKFPDKEPPTLP